MSDDNLKQLPPLFSDAQAEREVEGIDLSDYNLSGFKPVRFELSNKDQSIHLRLPAMLLERVKAEAARRNMPYSRFIRSAIEHALTPQ